ncbi:RcnB family protein [Sphingopyxis sp. PET50]
MRAIIACHAAYGGYRWVRYYNDALLVDTYSGEVVDVIYDFFW